MLTQMCYAHTHSPSSVGMFRVHPYVEGPLVPRLKRGRDHCVTTRLQGHPPKDAHPVGVGDGRHMLWDVVQAILSVLLHLQARG